jgi:hypothetical protein
MENKAKVILNLTEAQTKGMLAHFNSIYECKELSGHEHKIIYLARMWANGFILKDKNGTSTFNETHVGIPLSDYEITFENEHSGGVNLDLMREFYNIDKIIEIMSPFT